MNQAAQINQYLAAHHSPLAGMGNAFVRAGSRYGIDPLLLVAITGAESSFGAHLSGAHNPFGWGPGKSFGSFGQAINTVASGLRSGYLNQGLKTIAQIGGKWAPVGAGNDPSGLNNNWVRNVSGFYGELGGKGVGSAGGGSAPASPAPATEQPVAPDLSGVGFQGLTDIVSHHYSPSRGLQALAGAVAAAPQVQPQPTKPAAGKPGLAGGFLPAGSPYKRGRADQGRDFQTTPGGVILAPGSGYVVRIGSDPGGFGPNYPIVHFTSGPYAGRTMYIGHTHATLTAGQRFTAGQTISRTGTSPVGNASVPGWAEIGYADGGSPGRFGQQPPF